MYFGQSRASYFKSFALYIPSKWALMYWQICSNSNILIISLIDEYFFTSNENKKFFFLFFTKSLVGFFFITDSNLGLWKSLEKCFKSPGHRLQFWGGHPVRFLHSNSSVLEVYFLIFHSISSYFDFNILNIFCFYLKIFLKFLT